MDRPLWQLMFNIALIGFVARRAAIGLALHADRSQPNLWGVYAALITVCGFVSIAILFGRRWVTGGVIALLAAFTLSTCVELAIGTVAPAVWLVGQLAIAIAFGAVILWWAHRDRSMGAT